MINKTPMSVGSKWAYPLQENLEIQEIDDFNFSRLNDYHKVAEVPAHLGDTVMLTHNDSIPLKNRGTFIVVEFILLDGRVGYISDDYMVVLLDAADYNIVKCAEFEYGSPYVYQIGDDVVLTTDEDSSSFMMHEKLTVVDVIIDDTLTVAVTRGGRNFHYTALISQFRPYKASNPVAVFDIETFTPDEDFFFGDVVMVAVDGEDVDLFSQILNTGRLEGSTYSDDHPSFSDDPIDWARLNTFLSPEEGEQCLNEAAREVVEGTEPAEVFIEEFTAPHDLAEGVGQCREAISAFRCILSKTRTTASMTLPLEDVSTLFGGLISMDIGLEWIEKANQNYIKVMQS